LPMETVRGEVHTVLDERRGLGCLGPKLPLACCTPWEGGVSSREEE
jgi:hypothetical protein